MVVILIEHLVSVIESYLHKLQGTRPVVHTQLLVDHGATVQDKGSVGINALTPLTLGQSLLQQLSGSQRLQPVVLVEMDQSVLNDLGLLQVSLEDLSLSPSHFNALLINLHALLRHVVQELRVNIVISGQFKQPQLSRVFLLDALTDQQPLSYVGFVKSLEQEGVEVDHLHMGLVGIDEGGDLVRPLFILVQNVLYNLVDLELGDFICESEVVLLDFRNEGFGHQGFQLFVVVSEGSLVLLNGDVVVHVEKAIGARRLLPIAAETLFKDLVFRLQSHSPVVESVPLELISVEDEGIVVAAL